MTNAQSSAPFGSLPQAPWSADPDAVLSELEVDQQGLSSADAERRRRQYGPNRLRQAARASTWTILLNQFKGLLIGLLLVASVVAFLFGETVEGLAIAVVILVNAAIGFVTELRAVRSMEALRELTQATAVVVRDGEAQEIPADRLVPGDVVRVEGGDLLTADLRLLEASKLQADESSLTGESVPVGKSIDAVPDDAPLAERTCMLYKGTALTRGSGLGVVTSTGMATELGHISQLVEEAEESRTPLEERLDALGRQLVGVTLAITAVIIAVGIGRGKDLFLMVETGIALAVATVPEGLPIVATLALARGMWRMAQRNALINQLSAVETLGATNVICTDKTGTLTENRMTVTDVALTAGEVDLASNGDVDDANGALRAALEIGALCNNASLSSDSEASEKGVGDPLEVALLAAAQRAGLDRAALVGSAPEVREEAFDPDIRMMATFHETDDGEYRVAVKGAPEAVFDVCADVRSNGSPSPLDDDTRSEWDARNGALAEDGLRLIAVAEKTVGDLNANPYEDLTLVGLIGLMDPPRGDVRDAIDECQDAGVRVVMVTGDQPVTARNIALEVGLVEDVDNGVMLGQELDDPASLTEDDRRRLIDAPIFARVSPAQKLDLIALHQSTGNVVAMTGDGVNDAPALKKADIGVAMGQRGTQVAREAADMVLKDDAFATIVAAVEQGRVIFTNIRRFVLYLLSCNVSEVMIIGLATLAGAALPILPLQILFLNLVTDVFPALALGVGEGGKAIMKQPPRDPGEPIIGRPHWRAIAGYGGLITAAVLGAFAMAFAWLEMPPAGAVTISFLTLAFAQLWHVFNMREAGSGLLSNEIVRNPWVWGAVALCVGLLIAAVYVPTLATVLKVTDPGPRGWGLVIGMSLVPLAFGQLAKVVYRLRSSM